MLLTPEKKHLEPDCLPPVEATNLLSYLVLETSYYRRNSLIRPLGILKSMIRSGFVLDFPGVFNEFSRNFYKIFMYYMYIVFQCLPRYYFPHPPS